MSTCFRDKQTNLAAVVEGGGGFHHDDARDKNLNLNQQQPHHECHQIVTSNNTLKEYHGTGGYKQADLQMGDRRGNWKGNQKLETTTPKLFSFDKREDKAMNVDSNKSTLSLHIAAYENSVEAENAQKAVEDKKKIGKTWKELKKDLSDSAKMATFEIPRQQPTATTNPEVMQFRSSQQLANTHQSNPPQQETEETDPKPDHFMSISKAAVVRKRRQHLCESDIFESLVPYNGKEYVIKYQLYAYPNGFNPKNRQHGYFNIVIQLVENPLFDKVQLKATYNINFEDKIGTEHESNDSKVFDKSSASTDIGLMYLKEFRNIMKNDGQDIHFKINFFADGELMPFPNEEVDDSKECISVFPEDLSNLECCVRLSPEYYCKKIKWQYRLFPKNGKLFIDFQVLKNPYGKKFDATFKIEANGSKVKTVTHQFGASLRSQAFEMKDLHELPESYEVEVFPFFEGI